MSGQQQDEATELLHISYRKLHPQVFHYLYCRVKDWELAEDLTSETFLKAIRYRRNPPTEYLAPWLITIARNLMYDHFRSARFRYEVSAETVEPQVPTCSAEEIFMREAEAETLRAAISHLTTNQQRILRYRFLEDLSVRETADLMSRHDGAVRSLQFRALRNLAQILSLELSTRIETGIPV
ncbi:RNA polymerase sigma factor [Streptomyces sp. NPDC057686]|uniref:RNA polymerase sigma factor n=1 Tax=Streptomyces sp. NPDC057686 TaxID=3346212 RepID=UPI00369CAEE5